MKNVTLFVVILSFLFSCKALDKLTQFHIDYTETITIPSTTLINLPIDVVSPEVTTNSESVFASNDTRKDLIEEIKLVELKATITSPSSSDFSFMENAYIYINAENLPEQRIAYLENIPVNVGNVLEFIEEDVDLKEYIKKDSYTVRLNYTTDEVNTENLTVELYSDFFIDAKILGI